MEWGIDFPHTMFYDLFRIKFLGRSKMNHYDEGFVCGHWPFDDNIISNIHCPSASISFCKKALICPWPDGIILGEWFFDPDDFFKIINDYKGPVAGIIGGPGSCDPDRPF